MRPGEGTPNNVQPLHEKAKRGRPVNAFIRDVIIPAYPEGKSRRTYWNLLSHARVTGLFIEHGLIANTKMPLPPTVMYVLGEQNNSDDDILTLGREAIRRHTKGEQARELVPWLRGELFRRSLQLGQLYNQLNNQQGASTHE